MLALLIAVSAVYGQEPVDLEITSRIRAEALHNSKVMEILLHLTDEIGPRLTNSPSMKAANNYTMELLEEWGLKAELESFEFGRGWSFSHASVHMLEPRAKPLMALPKAWTPGTEGPVQGEAILVNIKAEEDMEQWTGKLAGKIVFADKARAYEHKQEADFQRYSHDELDDLCRYEIPNKGKPGRRAKWKKYYKLAKKLTPWYKQEGVLTVIKISSRDDGIIRVSGSRAYKKDAELGVPSLVMSAENYNMVVRKLKADETVKLSLDVAARFHDEDLLGYNTIGELTGVGPLKDEIVMAGAHMDSWHAASGAVDNGAGVAVVMEAIRILKQLNLRTRRTIRVGLWSGEEQGLYGSRAHVESRYADFQLPEGAGEMSAWAKRRLSKPIPKAAHTKFSAYYNLDNGGGKIRGIYTEQNTAVAPIFKAWLAPFEDLGAGWVTNNDTGGTDHQSFDRAGLPGFQFIQDPLSYSTKNHHSNLDVYDQVVPADLKQAAAIMASFLYHTAMRDKKMPRKPLPKAKPKQNHKHSKRQTDNKVTTQ